jgi:hypothetical protein
MTRGARPCNRPADREPALPDRLRFLASGATQHVFVAADGNAAQWVFKTPALVDALLPSDPVKAVSERWQPWIRFLGRQPPVNGLLRRRLRMLRAKSFREMGRILSDLAAAGLGSCVAGFRWIPDAEARLDLPHGIVSYRGPLLQQRRADCFFEDGRDLQGFDVAVFLAMQRRLWQAGFGLVDAACAFGPDGWAHVDGRLVLADTGSLTRDRDRAIAVLADDRREFMRRRHLRKAGPDAESHVDQYFALLTNNVSADALRCAWGRKPHREAGVADMAHHPSIGDRPTRTP